MAAEEIEETDLDGRFAERHDGLRAGEQNERIRYGEGAGDSGQPFDRHKRVFSRRDLPGGRHVLARKEIPRSRATGQHHL